MAATTIAQAALASTVIKSSFVTGKALKASRVAAAPQKFAFSVRAERPLYLPGSTPPAYLDGTLAGDFGFDPLGLAAEPANLSWYVQAELVHSRWAMLGAAGILITDALRTAGALDIVPWYEAGVQDYGISAPVLTFIEIVAVGWAESKRWADIKNPGSVNQDPLFTSYSVKGTVGYPGFDPLTLGAGPEKKLQELKNGRLAMLATAGFWAQAAYTGVGPTQNLLDHLADPAHNNFIASFFG